jgi:hypothetical protein
VAVADVHVQVAVDAIEVEQVELLERLTLALLSLLDESRQILGRSAAAQRGRAGGLRGHRA